MYAPNVYYICEVMCDFVCEPVNLYERMLDAVCVRGSPVDDRLLEVRDMLELFQTVLNDDRSHEVRVYHRYRVRRIGVCNRIPY